MRMLRLFISSVQKEFAAERAALAEHLRGDPLLRRTSPEAGSRNTG